MLGVDGLKHHRNNAGGDIGLFILAAVVDADDIGTGLCDDVKQRHKAAGLVNDLGGDVGYSARFGKALGYDAGDHGNIDVAARNNTYRLKRGIYLVKHIGSHRGCTCALGNGLFTFHKGKDSGGYLVVVYGDYLVDIFAAKLKGGSPAE